ncbi:MAG: diversity-generating retroelement protein Avd [Candidatus Riflebacteria bacterium]|nr:diversity-generating retroelement protein Avd [Candidatus Riflebacteria bacterium]
MTERKNPAEPTVTVALYDFCLWIMQRTNRFPKNWRVTLGDKIDRVALEMLVLARHAAARTEKTSCLVRLSDNLETLRMMVRLAKDLKCLEIKQYEFASRSFDEIGRQVGGWLKYTKGKK